MKIKDIENILSKCLRDKENLELKNQYEEMLETYFSNTPKVSESIGIIIEGMDIDKGNGFFDYIIGLPRKKISTIFGEIKGNRLVLENKNGNAIKLYAGMLYLAIIREGQLAAITGDIISELDAVTRSTKHPIEEKVYLPILKEYFIDQFVEFNNDGYKWGNLNRNANVIKRFSEMMLKSMEDDRNPELYGIKQWIKSGIQYANMELEKQEIEQKIPKSRTDTLKELLKHYEDIEGKLRNSIYEIYRLEKIVKKAEVEIATLNVEKKALQEEIMHLKNKVDKQDDELQNAQKEVQERKDLNDAFDSLKKNDEEGMLKDIANALKFEYEECNECMDEPMDVELGEIYREKCKSIFKILEQKGVKVE